MKKWVIGLLIGVFLISLVSAVNYPAPFVTSPGLADVAIVISDNAAAKESIYAVDLASNLQTELAKYISSSGDSGTTTELGTITYLDKNLNDFKNKNLISISVNCNNDISNSILGLNADCSNLEDKVGSGIKYIIKVVQSPYNENKIFMVILATSTDNLKSAVDYIIANKPSTDIGTFLKGTGAVEVPVCEPQFTCDDGYTPKCEMIDNECVCETCPAEPTESECTDSDGGKNYYVKGHTEESSCVASPGTTCTGKSFDDECFNSKTLREGFCDGNNVNTKDYECPNGCEDGVCIIGEEKSCIKEGEVVNAMEGRECCESLVAVLISKSIFKCISVSCNPIGLRSEGKYCSIDYIWVEQSKGNEACDNNFECESNVCVSGKCVSAGLLERIINWFKKLFGM